VDDVKYRRPSADLAGRMQLTQMKIRSDDDMRMMYSIFGQYSSKDSIKLDASLIKFVE